MRKIDVKKIKRQEACIWVFLVITLILLVLPLAVRTYVFADGEYRTARRVALYIYTYDELPSNYVTKSEAEDGSVQPADGRMIGGDVFAYEGAITALTDVRDLRECDVDYPEGENGRGAHRLVYAADGSQVWFTDDHYASFTLLSPWSLNAASNALWISFGAFLGLELGIAVAVCIFGDGKIFLENVRSVFIMGLIIAGVILLFVPVFIAFWIWYAAQRGIKDKASPEN